MRRLKAILAVCVLVAAANAFGQGTPDGPNEPDQAAETPPVPSMSEVDEPPKFLDGDIYTFWAWVEARISIPRGTWDPPTRGGKVVVKFFIERDGSLSNIEVVASPDCNLSDEALRVISLSPAWTPARHKGETVKVIVYLPVDFVLYND